MLSLEYFLLIAVVKFFVASLFFAIRICNFFLWWLFLLWEKLLNKPWLTTTKTIQQPITPLKALAYICSWKVPRIPTFTQSQELSAASKITPLLEHEANHSQLLWSSPFSPYLGLKWKHILTIFLCFLRNKFPEFSLQGGFLIWVPFPRLLAWIKLIKKQQQHHHTWQMIPWGAIRKKWIFYSLPFFMLCSLMLYWFLA